MKRIAGIFNFNHRPISSSEIHRMLIAMDFTNINVKGIWIDGELGLGCTRTENLLREQDGYTPMDPTGQGCFIAFDGRVDNRSELMATLKAYLTANYPPISDEELLLAAYEKWGLGCPKHLIGDFAFAIWDAKKRQLICARDQFGVKPFYYHLSKNSFVFASTPRALLASTHVPAVIHGERIADFLVNFLEGVDEISSFYSDVLRLPPAHMLIVNPQGITVKRYWELGRAVQPTWKTEADYLEAFQELFKEAVRCRLWDLDAPASMLSGGMDSSAIIGMGRSILTETGGSPLHAFAVISNSQNSNRETKHISSLLDQGNLKFHLISETNLYQWMDELVRAIEVEAEPFDYLMNLNRSVYLHARDQQFAALQDGVDGDVLLPHSIHLTWLWRKAAINTVIGETLKADGQIAEYKRGRSLFFSSFISALATLAPDPVWRMRQRWINQSAIDSAIRESIIESEFAVHSHLGERIATLNSHSPRPPSFTNMEFHKITLNHPFLTVGLERYERVASAFEIEARHPLLDIRLVEFCLGLPWQLKTQNGWTKLILRYSMEPYLPKEVVWRKDKDSLMWEVNRLILKERAEYFYQITLDERANLKPYVDTGKLMKFWDDYLSRGNEENSQLIWSGIALAMWLRQQKTLV